MYLFISEIPIVQVVTMEKEIPLCMYMGTVCITWYMYVHNYTILCTCKCLRLLGLGGVGGGGATIKEYMYVTMCVYATIVLYLK